MCLYISAFLLQYVVFDGHCSYSDLYSLGIRWKLLSVGDFVDHDMVFFLQREKSTWIANNSGLLDFFLFSISGTGLKVILLIGSLKVISPFLFVAHKILPFFFFFNLNTCQRDFWKGVDRYCYYYSIAVWNCYHFIIAYGFCGSGIQRQPSRDGLSLLHKAWGLSERRLVWLGDGSSVGFCSGISGASAWLESGLCGVCQLEWSFVASPCSMESSQWVTGLWERVPWEWAF